ncbi:MAG: O-methyltransferase [Rhodobiaceae bacterium]|nr:O-methyltransferase [Rhodobiaceae bacterium]
MAETTLGLTTALADWLGRSAMRESEALKALRAETLALPGVGNWAMAAEEGQFIALLAQIAGVKSYLELGTFTGYGTLWVASALPDAEIITCEAFGDHLDLARRHWAAAGVADRIDLRLSDATELLDSLIAERGENALDMVFIDADKKPYPAYYARAIRLVRPGGLVLLDNAFRHGAVADPDDRSKATQAIRDVTLTIRDDDRVDMALVPIADGLLIARKR